MADESPLEVVRRHVREGRDHLHRQHEIVSRYEGETSTFAQEARDLLGVLTSAQETHQEHLRLLEEEQRAGRRDGDGHLLPLRTPR